MPSGDIGRQVHELLSGMLDFDAKRRPSAAESMSRLRAIARALRQIGVEEWSASVIPPLIRQVQKRQEQRGSTSALLDNSFQEDEGTAAFRRAGVSARPESGTDSSELGSSTTVPTTLKRAAGVDKLANSSVLAPPESLDVPRPGLVLDDQGSVAPAQPSAAPHSVAPSSAPSSVAPADSGRMGSRLMIIVLGLLTGALALFVGVLLTGGLVVMLVFMQKGSEQPKTAAPIVAPSISKVAAPLGPHSQFISMLPGTKKVSVRCESGSGSGVMEATVSGQTLGTCTVTALYDGRKRQTAMVKDVKPVRYKCFREGSKECVVATP